MNPTSDPLGLSDPLRNPERLTAEQLGGGFQCLTAEQRAAKAPCEFRFNGPQWYEYEWDDFEDSKWTLRCPISQPLPATGTQPESEVKPCADTDQARAHSLTASASNTPVAVPSGDAGELKPCPRALYSCKNHGCAIEQTFPPEDLFWSDEKQGWFCRECYEDFANPTQTLAQYLARAEPPELTQLHAENESLRSQLAELEKDKFRAAVDAARQPTTEQP